GSPSRRTSRRIHHAEYDSTVRAVPSALIILTGSTSADRSGGSSAIRRSARGHASSTTYSRSRIAVSSATMTPGPPASSAHAARSERSESDSGGSYGSTSAPATRASV